MSIANNENTMNNDEYNDYLDFEFPIIQFFDEDFIESFNEDTNVFSDDDSPIVFFVDHIGVGCWSLCWFSVVRNTAQRDTESRYKKKTASRLGDPRTYASCGQLRFSSCQFFHSVMMFCCVFLIYGPL